MSLFFAFINMLHSVMICGSFYITFPFSINACRYQVSDSLLSRVCILILKTRSKITRNFSSTCYGCAKTIYKSMPEVRN